MSYFSFFLFPFSFFCLLSFEACCRAAIRFVEDTAEGKQSQKFVQVDDKFLRFVGDTVEGDLLPPSGRRLLDSFFGREHAGDLPQGRL